MTEFHISSRQSKMLLKQHFKEIFDSEDIRMGKKSAIGIRFDPTELFEEFIAWNAEQLVNKHGNHLLEQPWVPKELKLKLESL